MNLTDLLEELADHWRRQRAPILDHLRPGVTSREIDRLLVPIGINLPEDVRELWRWHDGVHAGADRANRFMTPFHQFLSLEEAMRKREELAAVARRAGPDAAPGI